MTLDYANPQKYIGNYHSCYVGYSNNEEIRSGAASGGMVTSILLYLLENGIIQGALVSRQVMNDNRIDYETFVASTKEEILDCRTSIYMEFPLVKHYKKILDFNGKVAVVALPCQLKALKNMEIKYPELKDKIEVKISLFCSGSTSVELVERILRKNQVNSEGIKRIYFRKGHWRGKTHIVMKDGSERTFSYLYNLCTYRNLYFFTMSRCFSCQDQFGFFSDISCGDVWLKEMKKNPIKHTGIIAKNQKAFDILQKMKGSGAVNLQEVDGGAVVKSQKRALIYKINSARARGKIGSLFGLKNTVLDAGPSKWNYYLAALLIVFNIKWSRNPRWNKLIFFFPQRIMFLYMCFLRTLISF